jgi:nucleoside-diphosphate-sugar epimerase
MNILITGANGFVGLHLVEKLLKEGHEVWALVRNPQKINIVDSKLHLIKGDLSPRLELSDSIVEALDTVIHTAGIVHSFNPKEFYQINGLGTKILIEKLNLAKPNLHFILISSLAARGPIIGLERPVSHYGKSKKVAENFLENHAPSTWSKIVIRPPMIIGPRDTAVLDIFKMVKDGVVILPGLHAKDKKYSFVCVFDLIETITKSISVKENTLIYSAYPVSITFVELISTVKKFLNKKTILFLPIPEFFISLIAYTLLAIHKVFKHQLRITPDKTRELFPNEWVCQSEFAITHLKQEFKFDLKSTVEITATDYQSKNWI